LQNVLIERIHSKACIADFLLKGFWFICGNLASATGPAMTTFCRHAFSGQKHASKWISYGEMLFSAKNTARNEDLLKKCFFRLKNLTFTRNWMKVIFFLVKIWKCQDSAPF